MKIPPKYAAFRAQIESIIYFTHLERPDLGRGASILELEIAESELTYEIFWELYSEELVQSSITQLDLSKGALEDWSEETWFMMCNAIAGSKLKSLQLSGNNLQDISNQQLQALCIAIACSQIESIDFRECHLLNYMSNARWELFCTLLAKSKITSIYLGEENSPAISLERLLEFPNALSASAFLIYSHRRWDEIQKLLLQKRFNSIDGLNELEEYLSIGNWNFSREEFRAFHARRPSAEYNNMMTALFLKQQEFISSY